MLLIRLIIVAIFILLMNISSQNAFAGSGGFRNESIDAATLGIGNAFVGQADTPAAVYYNPAGLNQIDTIESSISVIDLAPRADFKDLNGNTTQMRNNEFVIPTSYTVVPIIKNKVTVGVGAGSYWGLGTDWAQDSFSKYVGTKNDLRNTDTMLTGAYQLTDRWSIAAGVDNDFSKVDENKKFANSSFDPTPSNGNLELKAKDDAWGYRLATMFKINDQNQVGLMYRSPITHNYIGHAYVDGIGPTFSGLIFGGATAYETRVTEKLTLPQSVVLGYTLKPTSKWTLNADLEWMDWSSVKHELLGFPDASTVGGAFSPSAFLNTGNPLQHDWTSSWCEEIGAQYAVNDRFRLRTGYYHHQVVGPTDFFNSVIPDMDAHGITFGIGYDFNSHLTIDVGYAAVFYVPRKINADLTSSALNGTYYQFINDGVVTLTYKF